MQDDDQHDVASSSVSITRHRNRLRLPADERTDLPEPAVWPEGTAATYRYTQRWG